MTPRQRSILCDLSMHLAKAVDDLSVELARACVEEHGFDRHVVAQRHMVPARLAAQAVKSWQDILWDLEPSLPVLEPLLALGARLVRPAGTNDVGNHRRQHNGQWHTSHGSYSSPDMRQDVSVVLTRANRLNAELGPAPEPILVIASNAVECSTVHCRPLMKDHD